MTTDAGRVHRGRAARRPHDRRAAHRRRRALPRRLRRRRHLRLAPHQAPRARPSRPGRRSTPSTFGTELLDVPLDTWPAHYPQRRPGPLPHPGRRARAAHRDAHPHRHRRGLRRQHPPAAARRPAAPLRRGHPGHRHRPPRQGPVRGPRPRRGRLRGGGRPQGHVVRRPRHRLREPDRRRSTSSAMLARMGFGQPGGPGGVDVERALPDDIDVEPRAHRRPHDPGAASSRSRRSTPSPGPRTWLSDPDLVAGDGEAAGLVSYIRADETPHVEYLKTALTEMRDRTWVGTGGKQHAGHRDDRHALGPRPRAVASAPAGPQTRKADPRRGRALVPPARRRRRHPRRVPLARAPTPRQRPSRMKFGIFYEHQLPRPWEEDSERQLIQDALEQVELADKLGFDVVWEVEHHFLEEYSHSSAPEVFLAAAQPAHQGHPPRPRHHPDRARLQPPGPHRRAGRHARPRVQRPGRVRLRRVVVRGRAGRLRHRPGRQARGVARGPRGRHLAA